MVQSIFSICIALLVLSSASQVSHAAWQRHSYVSAGLSTQYAIHAPTPKAERTPIILFMHGAGERGDNLNMVLKHTVSKILAAAPKAIVLVPQVPAGRWWTDPEVQRFTIQTLEKVIRDHSGDRTRLYLVGLSMGGHGVIHLSASNPDTFAAQIAICPRIKRPNYVSTGRHLETNPTKLAMSLKHTPTWLFHGDQDNVVPVTNSRRLNRALTKVGGDVNYTEIPGGQHNIWGEVISGELAMPWLLKQRRQLSSLVPLASDRSKTIKLYP